MLGYIECRDGGGKPRLAQEKRLGGSFLVLHLDRDANGFPARRRAERAVRQMRDQGVRRAVFPVDCPYMEMFRRCGISPIDPLPLRRALCVPLVMQRLRALNLSEHQAVVAIAGEHMTGEIGEITRGFALANRHVLLSVRSGGEAFARELRQRYGVSLLLHPSPGQLDRAHALILFSRRSELRQENPVLCSLYPGCGGRGQVPLLLGQEFAETISPNCSEEQLAAALYSMGILSIGRLLGEITC